MSDGNNFKHSTRIIYDVKNPISAPHYPIFVTASQSFFATSRTRCMFEFEDFSGNPGKHLRWQRIHFSLRGFFDPNLIFSRGTHFFLSARYCLNGRECSHVVWQSKSNRANPQRSSLSWAIPANGILRFNLGRAFKAVGKISAVACDPAWVSSFGYDTQFLFPISIVIHYKPCSQSYPKTYSKNGL